MADAAAKTEFLDSIISPQAPLFPRMWHVVADGYVTRAERGLAMKALQRDASQDARSIPVPEQVRDMRAATEEAQAWFDRERFEYTGWDEA